MSNNRLTLAIIASGLCLFCASNANAELVVNGDFSSGDLSGWTTTPMAPTTIDYTAAEGVSGGSAALARNDSTAVNDGSFIYQVIAVTSGQSYKFDASWKGDLLNGGTGRNWAEVFVEFAPTAAAVPTTIIYKKATDGGPNDAVMPFDWQSVLLSPNSAAVPTDGVFAATDDFMVVGFKLGGRAITSNNAQPGFFFLDNVTVNAVPEPNSLALLGLGGFGLLLRRRRKTTR